MRTANGIDAKAIFIPIRYCDANRYWYRSQLDGIARAIVHVIAQGYIFE
jgi:hypothetical protein